MSGTGKEVMKGSRKKQKLNDKTRTVGESGVNNINNNKTSNSKIPAESDCRSYKSSLGEEVTHSFETGLYTDVSFIVGPAGVTINAHKSILMIRSEVFARMFSERWTPTDPNEDRRVVFLPELDPDTFKIFVKYLYTDALPKETDLDVRGGLEILDLAHFYHVPSLIFKCSNFLESKIDKDTWMEIYQKTRLYTEMDLSKNALDFMSSDIVSVVESDQFLHFDVTILKYLLENDCIAIEELQLFKALLRWSDVEGTVKDEDGEERTRKEVMMQSLMPLIRFLLIAAPEFVKEVVPTKVLSDAQAFEIMCCKLNENTKKNEQMKKWSKKRGRYQHQLCHCSGYSCHCISGLYGFKFNKNAFY